MLRCVYWTACYRSCWLVRLEPPDRSKTVHMWHLAEPAFCKYIYVGLLGPADNLVLGSRCFNTCMCNQVNVDTLQTVSKTHSLGFLFHYCNESQQSTFHESGVDCAKVMYPVRVAFKCSRLLKTFSVEKMVVLSVRLLLQLYGCYNIAINTKRWSINI